MMAMFVEGDIKSQLAFADAISEGCPPLHCAEQYAAVRAACDELRNMGEFCDPETHRLSTRLLERADKLLRDYENADPVKLFNDNVNRYLAKNTSTRD